MSSQNSLGADARFQVLGEPIFTIFYPGVSLDEAQPLIRDWNRNRCTSSRAAIYDINLEHTEGEKRVSEHFIVKSSIGVKYGNGSIAQFNAETARKAVQMSAITKDINFAPQVYEIEIPEVKGVVMRRIEDDEGNPAVSLDRILENEDKNERARTLEDYFRTHARYQVRATIAHRKLIETGQEKTWLWQGPQFPGTREKAIHYFLGTTGLKRDQVSPKLLTKIQECYAPIILRHEDPCSIKQLKFELPFICHGDGCTTNALYVAKDKKWYIIDPRFILGHPLTDFAAIASCPGMTSYNGFDSHKRFAVSDWLKKGEEYILIFNEEDAASRGVHKVEGTGITLTLGTREHFAVVPETRPFLNGIFLTEFFHYSFRNHAVNNTIQRENPVTYKEMFDTWPSFTYSRRFNEMPKNMKAVEYMLRQPKEYGLSSEEGDKIGELVRILDEHGAIPTPGDPR